STDQHAGGTSRIAWFPNLASGVLGTQQDIYVGNPPLEHFVLRDYDLDGQVDILASTYYEYRILFFRGQPGATFLAPQPIEGTLGKTRGFSLHDLDHDGDWDIVGRAVDPATTGIDKVFVSYSLANDESISGIIFNDLNANGEQDPGEMGIGRVPIQVEPDALAVFADEEGQFTVYGADGTYTLIPQPDDCWTLTSMPAAYEVTFDGTYLDTLRFGLGPDTETPEAGVSLASAPTRCGFTVPFWLNYRNDGCWTFDGEVYLVLHELATFAEATPMPTHTEGDTLFWSFNDLPPGSSQSVELVMTIAGVEFLGSTLEISTGIIPNNAMGQALPAETFAFYSIINCAYDPNDKQVYPNRAEQPPFTENYTLFDENLLYTLRFQNTGTDTAFNIVLRDQLSPDLDWSTFRPGSSSHPYEATLHDDGLLEFHFRDILLPDSTTNEPGSHGFVQFEIKALPGLAEGTAIENTAGIYFDFNPPIITNTVNSMMVTSLPNFSPAAAFTYVANELTVDFSDASTNVPDSWLWEFGDGETSMDQHPVHSFAAGGTYPVCLTVSNDWGSAQYCENITLMATATQDPLASTGITFQPNPARETVWLETTLPVPQQLVLFSAAGQPLQTIILREKRMTWDISTLPAGSYWLRTEQGEVWPLVVVK
ncbi:MAG: PKD domain-containing protein, partial [Lewinella sp.]|nr:PKD domain-containing protein [Lewinella sp.]